MSEFPTREGLHALRDLVHPASEAPKVHDLPGAGAFTAIRDGHRLEVLPAVHTRHHVFGDPLSLAAWLLRHGEPESAEILVGSKSIEALLDPTDGPSDAVSCQLALHPVFDRWRAVFGYRMGQKAFHGFLRRVGDDFPAQVVGGERFSEADRLIKAASNVQIAKDTKYEAEIDSRGTVTLASVGGKVTVSSQFPPDFEIEVPIFTDIAITETAGSSPWTHEPKYRIKVLLEIDASGDAPTFTLDAPDLPITMLAARKDAARCLREALGEGWIVGLGEPEVKRTLVAPRVSGVPFVQFLSRLIRVPSGDSQDPTAGEAAPPAEVSE